jgi:hypothetical protein
VQQRVSFLPIVACLIAFTASLACADDLQLAGVRRIWDAAPHNAFTDLVRHQDRWWCVFREGAAHVSPDGKLRVITSADGEAWESAALITLPEEESEDVPVRGDLRDAKISITPKGQLMLLGAAAANEPKPDPRSASSEPVTHQSYVWFSDDGREWGRPTPVGDPNYWLWRATWHNGVCYSIGYRVGADKHVRLYRSEDGRRFETLVARLQDEGYPNETSLVFLPDETALCLLRRDPQNGLLGSSAPPYTEWQWQDVGTRIGGPHMIRLPDGRLLAAVRLYDGNVRTSLCWINQDSGKLIEILALPSGGDSSYAGLVWQDERLWVSYYSSHEGKTSIYLANVTLAPAEKP